jgi:hypothetical protein
MQGRARNGAAPWQAGVRWRAGGLTGLQGQRECKRQASDDHGACRHKQGLGQVPGQSAQCCCRHRRLSATAVAATGQLTDDDGAEGGVHGSRRGIGGQLQNFHRCHGTGGQLGAAGGASRTAGGGQARRAAGGEGSGGQHFGECAMDVKKAAFGLGVDNSRSHPDTKNLFQKHLESRRNYCRNHGMITVPFNPHKEDSMQLQWR